MLINTLVCWLRRWGREEGGPVACLWMMVALGALGLALWQTHRAAHWAQAARQTQAAWAARSAAAVAAKEAAETRYRSLAHDADARYAAALAAGDARLAAYMAAHRMRRPSPTDPARPAADSGAGLSAKPAPGALMAPIDNGPVMTAISEADLKICDANYAYASAAHDWAVDLTP